MLASPNIASKRPVFRQYDHQVQNNTVVAPGGDAAVLRLQGTKKAIALSADCNGRLCYLDPMVGAAIAVAEACRNLACVGAEPLALTDGLNFGSPETPDVQYQLTQSITGMREAANAFGIPIVSGNASLYNESRGRAIFPTPIIGALGLIDDVARHTTIAFKDAGDQVVLLGSDSTWDGPSGLAGSEYLAFVHGLTVGQPSVDLDLESRVQAVCREAIRSGMIKSAHDCSEGGIAVTVAESAIAGNVGAQITETLPDRWDAALFGESQSRIVVSVAASDLDRLSQIAESPVVPYTSIGAVGGDHLKFGDNLVVQLARATDAWENGFERATGDE
jgi:phosphoribosylformylglycinamidine synthase